MIRHIVITGVLLLHGEFVPNDENSITVPTLAMAQTLLNAAPEMYCGQCTSAIWKIVSGDEYEMTQVPPIPKNDWTV